MPGSWTPRPEMPLLGCPEARLGCSDAQPLSSAARPAGVGRAYCVLCLRGLPVTVPQAVCLEVSLLFCLALESDRPTCTPAHFSATHPPSSSLVYKMETIAPSCGFVMTVNRIICVTCSPCAWQIALTLSLKHAFLGQRPHPGPFQVQPLSHLPVRRGVPPRSAIRGPSAALTRIRPSCLVPPPFAAPAQLWERTAAPRLSILISCLY